MSSEKELAYHDFFKIIQLISKACFLGKIYKVPFTGLNIMKENIREDSSNYQTIHILRVPFFIL